MHTHTCIYTYGLFRWWQWSAVENELTWNTAPLMAETTNAQSALFLTMPTAVEYCGVIHCRAFASLSILYSALDSILFIVLWSYEISSSPPHSILGIQIPVHNIDRKFNHGHFTLVLEPTLVLAWVVQRYVCPQTVPHIVSVWEFWSYPCVQVQATWGA